MAHLKMARSKMVEHSIKTVRASPVYLTPSWGDETQPFYLNQVIEVDFDFGPTDLLNELQAVEIEMGRKRHSWSEPRIIDLDIIAFGYDVIDEPGLKIPHPLLAERGFVLVPLSKIAPDFVHPVTRKCIKEMLKEVTANGIQIYRG